MTASANRRPSLLILSWYTAGKKQQSTTARFLAADRESGKSGKKKKKKKQEKKETRGTPVSRIDTSFDLHRGHCTRREAITSSGLSRNDGIICQPRIVSYDCYVRAIYHPYSGSPIISLNRTEALIPVIPTTWRRGRKSFAPQRSTRVESSNCE